MSEKTEAGSFFWYLSQPREQHVSIQEAQPATLTRVRPQPDFESVTACPLQDKARKFLLS